MRPVPIFDTSALRNLSDKDDLETLVKRLKPLIPSHGSPLSFITTIELFRGLAKSRPEHAARTIRPLLLGARISRREVLRVPLSFANWELFRTEEVFPHRPRLLVDWLKKVQTPDFAEQFASGNVTMDFERIDHVFNEIVEGHSRPTKMMLDRAYPEWREHRQGGRSALPDSIRDVANRAMVPEMMKAAMPEMLLKELQIEPTATNIEKARVHCDAYFTFQVHLERSSTIEGYHFDKNPNDFHDGLQFLYLTRPRFCYVTDDRPSLERTRRSSQRDRIMSLNEFLSNVA
jgi:hypothetical protein